MKTMMVASDLIVDGIIVFRSPENVDVDTNFKFLPASAAEIDSFIV